MRFAVLSYVVLRTAELACAATLTLTLTCLLGAS